MNIRTLAIIFGIYILAFLLGWHMRGDKIYGGMYERDHNNPMIQKLAEKINGR